MKRIIFTIFSFLLFAYIANANVINNIKMEIYLNKNGDAHIEEIWYTSGDDGTEYFHQYTNIGDSEIKNFTVKDPNHEYSYKSNWDINASFDEKKYHYGIHDIDDGYELCWGMSKKGSNTYHLSYDMTNMVKVTNDNKEIFYWIIFPPSTYTIKRYDITIKTDSLLPNDTDVWGYGAYGKLAYVSDGVIKLVGEDPLSSSEKVIALVKFKDNTFNASEKLDLSFDEIHKMAEKGATKFKEKNSFWETFAIIAGNVVPWIIIASIIGLASKNKNKHLKNLVYKEELYKKLPKEVPMFREIPCKKDIYCANYIANLYKIVKDDKNFIGCIILKWLKDAIIEADKESDSIILKCNELSESYTDNANEKKLYSWMVQASENNTLTLKSFKKYCEKNYNQILDWNSENYMVGRDYCKKNGYLIPDINNSKNDMVTLEFYEEGKKILGLKNFLVAFADMKNKEPIEVKLWDEYLMLAQLFGIAKKVAKLFNDLYPDVVQTSNFDYNTFIFINTFSNTGVSAASAAYQAARSYSAGGGGFSSGGGGGGAFGGGSMGGR